MSLITQLVGLKTLATLDELRPVAAHELDGVVRHLDGGGTFASYHTAALERANGGVLGAVNGLREHAPELLAHLPAGASSDAIVRGLRSAADDLHADRLPDRAESQLYRLPGIIDDLSASIRATLGDPEDIRLATAPHADTRSAAQRVADAIRANIGDAT